MQFLHGACCTMATRVSCGVMLTRMSSVIAMDTLNLASPIRWRLLLWPGSWPGI
jgi:hypothetical protein